MTELQPTMDKMAEVFNRETVLVNKVDRFTLASAFKVSRKEELHFWHTYEEELCNTAEYAKERVETFLSVYTDKDTRITIMTSRDPKYYLSTQNWLDKQDIHYDELVCVGKTSKVSLFEKMNVDAVFEDNPDFFYELWDEGLFPNIDTFCIDYPYNQHIPCHYRLNRFTAEEIPVGRVLSDDGNFGSFSCEKEVAI